MKKTAILAVAILLFAGCNKESGVPSVRGTKTVTITAGIEGPASRTSYDENGKFSWEAGDVIGVLYAEGSNVVQIPFVTAEGGIEATFTGEVADGLVPMNQASYPFTETYDGYARNDFAWDEDGFRLWGSIKPDTVNPLSSTPLLGIMEEDGFYQFRTACGIVKFTVVNAPVEMYFSYLETPAESNAWLNGWFTPDASGFVRMEYALEGKGYNDRYNWNTPTDINQTLDCYFFVPAGVLPAGTKFEICDTGWSAIRSFVFQQDVEVVRNAVTAIAPVEFEEVETYTLEDILGEYEMFVTAGPYSSNNAPGALVLEASDNAELGNVMITRFAGVAGKQYGTFDGLFIEFPKDQIFGDNPYEDAAEKPFVAIDFYKESVVNARFKVMGRGWLEAVDADAMGLRSCTAEDWAEYGGGWPWALCFGSISAKWPVPTEYVKGKEIVLKSSMVSVSNNCSFDGGGAGALIDGNPDTYWHSDYYYPIDNNSPVYGIYIDVVLDQTIDAFRFEYQVRSGNATAKPTSVVYGVSSDGVNWYEIGNEASDAMANAEAGDWVMLSSIHCGDYRYFRLGIVDSANQDEGSLTGNLNFEGYKKCTNIAELKLYWAE